MSKPLREFLFGTATALGAGLYSFEATRLPRNALSDSVGAGGLPFALGIVVALLGLALAARSGLSLIGGRAAAASPPDVAPPASVDPRSLMILALGAAYVVAAPFIGYLPAIALLIGAAAIVSGARRSWGTLLVAALLGAILFAVFVLLMRTSQPKGIIAGLPPSLGF